jgi:hypothetical protein
MMREHIRTSGTREGREAVQIIGAALLPSIEEGRIACMEKKGWIDGQYR